MVVSSFYHDSDGFSFGAGSEEWYWVKAKDLSETDRGKKIMVDYCEEKLLRRMVKEAEADMQKALKDLEKAISTTENQYKGESINLSDIPGKDIYDTFDIYGGGRIIRVSEDCVWLIINNGRDGDTWSINNILTGGAGAYGYKAPYLVMRDKQNAYAENELRFKGAKRDYDNFMFFREEV